MIKLDVNSKILSAQETLVKRHLGIDDIQYSSDVSKTIGCLFPIVDMTEEEFLSQSNFSVMDEDKFYSVFGDTPLKTVLVSVNEVVWRTEDLELVNMIVRQTSPKLKKDVISLGMRFYHEKHVWRKAGKPLRSEEEMDKIFTICEGCPNFNRHTPDVGDCNICGCYVKRKGTKLNKAALGTSNCPDDPPRWGNEINNQ